MKKSLLFLGPLCLVLSCTHKSLTEQLAGAFSNHLNHIDPNASLDSVRIIWSTPVNERLARTIDDTLYVREYNRIRWQLASALAKSNRDSVAFYRYEIHVLERGIDSISKSIEHGDTTHRYGSLISCAYYLKKNNKAISDSTLIFLDSAYVLRYTGYMDSSIARTTKSN
jgi:hypothetical protein